MAEQFQSPFFEGLDHAGSEIFQNWLVSEREDVRTFIRYDERGNDLSDWDVNDISFEAFVRDLETVIDALGLERFPLLGISQGCAVCVEYAGATLSGCHALC